MERHIDENIISVAKEIQNYLVNHPNAADSADGVMRWWLLQQRFEESIQTIQQALDLLVRQHSINKTITPGGSVIYFHAKVQANKDQWH